MIQGYDFFGQADPPAIFLCNPNRDRIASIARVIYDTKLITRFNALSEFSFRIPQSIDNKETILDAYGLMKVKRQIYIENVGYFIITSAIENSDGSVPILTVECQSLESELSNKKLNVLSGTCKLYTAGSSSISPEDNLLGYIVSLVPNWSIAGTISGTLASKYRTFDVSDSTIYGFLMNDVEKAYECIFRFDTINRLIYVDTLTDAVSDTDIFISYDNLAQETELSEMSDEIVTALHVYGGNSLDIRSVNPLGTNIIYNFAYYKNINWMSQSLINALTAWEDKVVSYEPQYYTYLANLMTYNNELYALQTTLEDYQTQYAALEVTLKATIETGGNVGTAQNNLANKQSQIDVVTGQITSKNSQISALTVEIVSVNTSLSFATNFTEPQFLELLPYIIENTYQNENLLIFDSYTPNQIQETKLELYNQAVSVLERVSIPRYEFSVKSVNFVNLPQFSHFTTQLEPGAQIVIDTTDYPIKSVLLEVELSYDIPENFSLTFSNRLRLDNGQFQYSDLVGQVVKTGTSVSFDKPKWSNWENTYKDTVSTFITSSLNATTNEIINSTNQEIVINGAGLRGKHLNDLGTYDSAQVWLTSNVLAFTDNNWQTSKLAIGKLNFGDGTSGYGIISSFLIGNIICGNQLTISNTANNFTLDQTGATLTDAKFLLKSSVGGSGGLIIDPSSANIFSIGARVANQIPNPTFAVDINGNVSMTGNLYAGSNYILTNGNAKIGALTISGNTATFDGTIRANKIDGYITGGQISSVNAGTVGGSGTFSGNYVYGGSPNVASVKVGNLLDIYSSGSVSIIDASGANSLQLVGAGRVGSITLGSSQISMNGPVSFNQLPIYSGSYLATQSYVSSSLSSYITKSGGTSISGLKLKTGYTGSSSYANLTFVNGQLTSVTYSST